MLNYLWIKCKDYIMITGLVLFHLKRKWNITNCKLFVLFDIFLLSMIIPVLINSLTDISIYFLVSTSFLYAAILNCMIIALYIRRANIPFSRVLYEIDYARRLLWFVILCYHNSVKEHKKFLIVNNLLNQGGTTYNYDVIVMSKVFRTIFYLYFRNMEEKEKSSEPYLIDTKEIKDLYTDQNFNELYTKIFFKNTKNNKPYEYLLIYILDHVLEDLYKKKWFVSYYDEFLLFTFINYILREWYDQIILFNISRIKVTNPIIA